MGGYGNLRSYPDGKGGTITVDISKNPELSKTPELDKKIATSNAERYGLAAGPKPNQPSQFDLARKRAAQQNAGQVQQAQDAMKRRAAQLGGGPRGAMLKQEQILQDNAQKNLADQNEGIDVAEAQEEARKQEIREGRAFQMKEREAGQEFATKSQMAQMQHQKNMMVEQNAYQERLINLELDFKKLVHSDSVKQAEEQLKLAMKQFDLDKLVTEFNMKMANQSKEAIMGNMRTHVGGFNWNGGWMRDWGYANAGALLGVPGAGAAYSDYEQRRS